MNPVNFNKEGSQALLHFEDWGLVNYDTAVNRQLQYVEEILLGTRPETIIFCSHPPLVSLGRGTKKEDLVSWKGQVVQSSRGGRATYHGPSQIIIYPLINLNKKRPHLKEKDIHAYLRLLEKILVSSLESLGYVGFCGKLALKKNTEGLEKTGLWKGELKVASIGIAIKKWVSYHGIAINYTKDKQAFTGIKACGYLSDTITSLEEIESKLVTKENLIKALSDNFNTFLQ
ncbi:MAG: lipoyl(octanoyl) transferase LipB [Bdellovibrionaceae bacterium]|nr:lipoyl(octanoyl) transferase LipB [Pseudobdellovibrionaceae bacterium]